MSNWSLEILYDNLVLMKPNKEQQLIMNEL